MRGGQRKRVDAEAPGCYTDRPSASVIVDRPSLLTLAQSWAGTAAPRSALLGGWLQSSMCCGVDVLQLLGCGLLLSLGWSRRRRRLMLASSMLLLLLLLLWPLLSPLLSPLPPMLFPQGAVAPSGAGAGNGAGGSTNSAPAG